MESSFIRKHWKSTLNYAYPGGRPDRSFDYLYRQFMEAAKHRGYHNRRPKPYNGLSNMIWAKLISCMVFRGFHLTWEMTL
jgi:hypothetical protein